MSETFWTDATKWFLDFLKEPTAVFTFALFVVTFLLWLATRGLVKGAEHTAERQLRAYVFVDDGRIAQIWAGTHVIYVYGVIQYRDAFKKRRTTRYRYMHGTITGQLGVTTDLTSCEEGNEAD